MGTVGICSASTPGLPAGFKQYAASATDTGRLAGGQSMTGPEMCVWEVLTRRWDEKVWEEISLS